MKQILLIDDNESFRRALSRVLQRGGYKVEAAAEGAAALKLFQKTKFNLVITDLVMPGKEGLETILELRQFEPALKIIAISGGGWTGSGVYLEMARRLGATKTLAKPFRVEEILKLVSEIFEGGNS